MLNDNQEKDEQVPLTSIYGNLWCSVKASVPISAQEQGTCCLKYGGGHRG